MKTAEVKVLSNGVDILDSLVVHSDERVVAMELIIRNDDLAIAAFGDGIAPSLIMTENSFKFPTNTSQRKAFLKISFPELMGFKIWSCDMSGDTLKICLLKSSLNF